MNWFLFWLFLHISALIIAFGPTFVFPLIGSIAPRHRQALHFAVELTHKMETSLIITANISLTQTPWLGIALILYLIAVGIAVFNQIPTTSKLLPLTASGPPPGAPPGPPPPEVQALLNRARMVGWCSRPC